LKGSKKEMFKKALNAVIPQPAKAWPTGEFRDRLSTLIVSAEKAGMTRGTIAAALENEAEAMRRLAARMINLAPPTLRDGHGRPI
jgi:hypothetical protein